MKREERNSQGKLDSSTSKPTVDNCHWENPKICCTCTFYYEDATDPIQPGCPRYIPKNTD